MQESYGRDLDLNLLRVFVAVADAGSVTGAAARLYLTQPAVSAALRRLTAAVGTPLLVRQGRGIALSSFGERTLAAVRPHLEALLAAALRPPVFAPATSEHELRIGLSDTTEGFLLPPLLRLLAQRAPNMAVVAISVQFRTVVEALTSRRVDLALSVVDDVPAGVKREPAFLGSFVGLYDHRHGELGATISKRAYFEREHVIVSYNGDRRGIIEDLGLPPRRVRCSVASFAHLGDLLEGSALLATVPETVARHLVQGRPHLATGKLPFRLQRTPVELLWPAAVHDDEACQFGRELLRTVIREEITRRRPSARA